MKIKWFIAFLLFIPLTNISVIFAGNETIEGYIFDGEKGVPDLIIEVSGKDKTFKTNRKGHFKIRGVSTEKDTIFVKITNDSVMEIPLLGANHITIRITEANIVVQYRERPKAVKSSYGGTIITREALERTGETNLLKAIALQAPGVQYIQGNLLIRGIKSFSLSNFPLYIINGGGATNVSFLTVMEVDSVEILKDASTSLFGSRGGNGVVIINLRDASRGMLEYVVD